MMNRPVVVEGLIFIIYLALAEILDLFSLLLSVKSVLEGMADLRVSKLLAVTTDVQATSADCFTITLTVAAT